MDNTTLSYILVAFLLIISAAYIFFRNRSITRKIHLPTARKGSVRGARKEEITQIVDMENFHFDPETIDIKPGTLVVWVNKDNFTHNVRSDTFTSPDVLPGGSFSSVFEIPGTYDYYCSIHPSMKGKIIVRE